DREAEAARKAIEDAPTDPAPRLALARLYRQAGRLDSAQEALAAGLGPTGHDFALSVELADLAVEPFRRHLAIVRDKRSERDDEELRHLEAELLREVNTRELDLYRLRADRQPGRPELRYELAVRLLRCGRTDEALTAFLESGPGWRSSRGAGYCYRLWGNARRALSHFEQAAAAVPEEEAAARHELLYELACCHAELGEYDRAVERGAELAERVPAYRDVLTLLPAWQSRARPAS
ncbi:MAG: tetratricopeptide repeat protein, partial [Gemmataceae bacterium]